MGVDWRRFQIRTMKEESVRARSALRRDSAVAGVAIEIFESRRSRDDEKSSAAHDLDGSFGGAVEEVNAEDAVYL